MPVQAVELAKAVFDRNEAILVQALDGLDDDALHRRVGPDSNPIGWLMWHLSRVQDNHLLAMEGKEHAWISEGWNERFGRGSHTPADRGRGHSSDEVAAFRLPGVETLVAYYKAVRGHADAFLDSLTEPDLDRQVPNLTDDGGTIPMHVRLEMCLVDTLQHSGQIAYLRGLIGGKGWLAA